MGYRVKDRYRQEGVAVLDKTAKVAQDIVGDAPVESRYQVSVSF